MNAPVGFALGCVRTVSSCRASALLAKPKSGKSEPDWHYAVALNSSLAFELTFVFRAVVVGFDSAMAFVVIDPN